MHKSVKLGIWNIRGLNGNEEELIIEFGKAKSKMCLIIETKIKGNEGHGLFYSCVNSKTWAHAGVACLE